MAKTLIKFLEPYEQQWAENIKKKGLTITISGPSESGKSTIGKAIARAFRLKYIFAGEIFRKIAKERGIPIEVFSKIREKEVDYEMDRRTLRYAMLGKVIIDGRLSGWVAGDWADVKIYVYCPTKIRAERVAKRDGIPLAKALEKIKQRDAADSEKYKKLYGIDQTDKSIYDIIIDNSKLTLEQTKSLPVERVKEFLKKCETKTEIVS